MFGCKESAIELAPPVR